MIVDGGLAAVRPGHRFDLGARDVFNAKTAAFALRFILDTGAFHTQDSADHRSQMGWMSSRLPGKNFSQRFGLRRRGPLVKIERYLPFRLEHVTWGMNGQNSIQALQLCVTEPSLVNMPGDQHRAVRRS